MMRTLTAILLALLYLTSCTGASDFKSMPKIDADGFFGIISKTYIHVESPQKATLVNFSDDYLKARKFQYNSSQGLVDEGEIPKNQITLSKEKKYLTLVGSPMLFEAVELKPEEVTPTVLVNLQNTVETLCIASPQESEMGTTGFQEVQFKFQNNSLVALGLNANGLQTLGTAQRQDQASITIYQIQNFGQFRIDRTKPLSSNPAYYNTSVTHASWSGANNIYCLFDQAVAHSPLYLDFGIASLVQNALGTHLLGTFSGTRNFDPSNSQSSLTATQNSIFIASYHTGNDFNNVRMITGTGPVSAISTKFDANGNQIILGSFSGTANFDLLGGSYPMTAVDTTDVFLAKYSNSGNLIWAYQFGAVGAGLTARTLELDAAGNAYFHGWFLTSVDLDPTAGVDPQTSLGFRDLFLTRINSNGSYGYTLHLGSNLSDGGYLGKIKIKNGFLYYSDGYKSTVNFNPNGAVFNLTTDNSTDVFVAKYTLDAQLVWVKTFPCLGFYQYTADINVDDAGNVYTLGNSGGGTISTDPNGGPASVITPPGGAAYYFAVKLDSNGNYGWSYMLPIATISWSPQFFDDLGNLYYGGNFSAPTNFNFYGGTDYYSPVGTQDAFLSRLNSDGTYGFTKVFSGGSGNSATINHWFPTPTGLFVQGSYNGTISLTSLGDTTPSHTSSTNTSFLISAPQSFLK